MAANVTIAISNTINIPTIGGDTSTLVLPSVNDGGSFSFYATFTSQSTDESGATTNNVITSITAIQANTWYTGVSVTSVNATTVCVSGAYSNVFHSSYDVLTQQTANTYTIQNIQGNSNIPFLGLVAWHVPSEFFTSTHYHVQTFNFTTYYAGNTGLYDTTPFDQWIYWNYPQEQINFNRLLEIGRAHV